MIYPDGRLVRMLPRQESPLGENRVTSRIVVLIPSEKKSSPAPVSYCGDFIDFFVQTNENCIQIMFLLMQRPSG